MNMMKIFSGVLMEIVCIFFIFGALSDLRDYKVGVKDYDRTGVVLLYVLISLSIAVGIVSLLRMIGIM